MAKTIVFRDNSRLGELVLGDKHVHYHTGKEENETEKAARVAEDVEYEEITTYCSYLDKEKIEATHLRTPMEVQQQLEEASRKDAKDFCEFLRKNEKLGYLDFQGHTKRDIFKTLRAELPMMRQYKESNFYGAF